jgi:hypothetical protein
MQDERKGLLLSYIVVKDKCWQGKSIESLNKRLMKYPLFLLNIEG